MVAKASDPSDLNEKDFTLSDIQAARDFNSLARISPNDQEAMMKLRTTEPPSDFAELHSANPELADVILQILWRDTNIDNAGGVAEYFATPGGIREWFSKLDKEARRAAEVACAGGYVSEYDSNLSA